MSVVSMRRSTRVSNTRVLRSGRRVWTAPLGEVGKKQRRTKSKVEQALSKKSRQEAKPILDNERHGEGFDFNQEKTETDIVENTAEEPNKESENLWGAVYERKDRISKDGSPVSYRSGFSGSRKRRSLRLRRGKTCSPFVPQKLNGSQATDLSLVHDDMIPCSPVASDQHAISPVTDNYITDVKVSNSISAGLRNNSDASTCCANILVIELDRCHREEGAVANLVKSDSNQWFVAIEKDGIRRYTVMAKQDMKPCSFNRMTHAIIWTCDIGWRLEFPHRRDWLIFKELYKACAEHNIQAPTVNVIPVPGVREVSSYSHNNFKSFRRPNSYITWKDDELTRALVKGTANYDLDCADELWLDKFNNEFFQDNQINKPVSDVALERIINSFEKGFYCGQGDYSDVRVAIDLSMNLERREVLEAVHNYWMRKREQKKSALARVFQCYQSRKTHISQMTIIRKKKSSNQQVGKRRRGQRTTFSQTEIKCFS